MRICNINSIILFLFFPCYNTYAGLTLDIRVTGNVLAPPPCVINNNQEILVQFGFLKLSEFNGVDNKKILKIPLSCSDAPYNDMVFSIEGDAAKFNKNIFSTSNPDIGTKISFNGKNVLPNINTSFVYADGYNINLEVELTKSSVATPDGGDLQASYIFKVNYL